MKKVLFVVASHYHYCVHHHTHVPIYSTVFVLLLMCTDGVSHSEHTKKSKAIEYTGKVVQYTVYNTVPGNI